MSDLQSTYFALAGLGILGGAFGWAQAAYQARREKQQKQAAPAAPLAPQPSHMLPLHRSADILDPHSVRAIELSNAVSLSRLARALDEQGLAISNTPRGTLQIHTQAGWQPKPATPANVIGFPLPGPRQAS